MQKYKMGEFLDAFENLGIKEGDTLYIHSSLYDFGIPMDCSIQKIPDVLFSYLMKLITDSGTLVVPAFNFSFCDGQPFDKQNTPSQKMGVFSEYVRKLSQSRRSSHPMQSVAVVGHHQQYLLENDTESAFSHGSVYDRLINLNAKVLLIGASINYVSVIHWAEQKYEVPYRFWKSFSGKYIDNGNEQNKTYRMYVRYRKNQAVLKMDSVEQQLINQNRMGQENIGAGFVKLFRLDDYISITESSLQKNPYYFVSNHPDFGKVR